MWLGANWIRINREEDEHAGVLAREQEIKSLKERMVAIENEVTELSAQQEVNREQLKDGEMRREELQSEVNRAHRSHADAKAQYEARKDRQDQLKKRADEVNAELAELNKEMDEHSEKIRETRARLADSMSSLQGFEADHEKLLAKRDELRAELDRARAKSKEDREAVHELALKVESRKSMREVAEAILLSEEL